MQIILVTQAGRRTRSLHVSGLQLVLLATLIGTCSLSAGLYGWVAGGANLTLLQRVVDIWEGTNSELLASKIGELSARMESLEAAMDLLPSGGPDGTLRRQNLGELNHRGLQRAVISSLGSRAERLQVEFDRQLKSRETAARSLLNRSLLVPVSGQVTSGFGWRDHPVFGEPAFHRGIDFSAPAGTAVHAAAPGQVTFIGPASAYGKLVVVSHGDRMQTRYAHLEGIEVTTGMAVYAGLRIGRVGSTGRSTGPHLHFELVLDGQVVNPKPFLESAGRRAAPRNAPSA